MRAEQHIDQPQTTTATGNQLFPVFLKLQHLQVLVVGGGAVATEKLQALLRNSKPLHVRVVATWFSPQVQELAAQYANVELVEKAFETSDPAGCQVALVAINDAEVSACISGVLKEQGILTNVADKPELCDFYLGSIVHKGEVKIGISTNGQSPTLARRLKEHISATLPDEIDALAQNLGRYRKTLDTDFAGKVKELERVTRSLQPALPDADVRWKRRARIALLVFASMLAGHFIFSYIPFDQLTSGTIDLYLQLDDNVGWVLLAGFLAQLVDGSLGMGYGITSATIMLSAGVNPAVMSGSIHTAEMFASGVSGLSHYRFGNVNKKLFWALVIPGVLGAVGGALLLVYFGEKEAWFLRPLMAAYTLFLGVKFIINAFQKQVAKKRFKHYRLLAGAGGFLDSFAGGGWGPIVTSTLINRGRSPRFVIGTVSLTEFFVTLSSAFAFFMLIGVSHWQAIVALMIGSTIAAPLAAKLAGRLPRKTAFILLGTLVIIWSVRLILKSL